MMPLPWNNSRPASRQRGASSMVLAAFCLVVLPMTPHAFVSNLTKISPKRRIITASASSSSSIDCIDYQSDEPIFGRGDQHLSALLCEGDTVVYRTGYWYVDGILVGNDNQKAQYELCRVDTIQLVWTHNCEHGVIRGLALAVNVGDNGNDNINDNTVLSLEGDSFVEFGPEQLIARIRNVEWEGEKGISPIRLEAALWKEHDGNTVYDEA